MTTIEPDAASATAERFAELSRRRARHGDVRRAQLAAWAADVHTLEALLWQNGLDQAPDPQAQLAGVGSAVAASVEALAGAVSGGLSARGVLEIAREAMVTTFDESVHGLLMDRFADLGHLDDVVPRADGGSEHGDAVDRLEGRSPVELVAELRTAAADCMAVAQVLAAEGEGDAAGRLARQSDNAAFEACLLSAAVGAGDHRLATVDLRWELAAGLEGDLDTGTGEDDLLARRQLFASLLGSAERETLRDLLEPVPEW